MRRLMFCLFAAVKIMFLLVTSAVASGAEPRLVTWDALVPSGYSAPSAGEDRFSRRGTDLDTIDHAAISGSGQSAQELLETWRHETEQVAAPLLDTPIVIDGYVLPLKWDGRQVVEFFLVPWVGACIHTPPPSPNQIIHVAYPQGLRLDKPFEPQRLSGTLRHVPSVKPLFLVDGSRPIASAYSLTQAETAGAPGEVVATSAQSLPLVTRVQLWSNTLFTDSMTALGDGGASRALFFALLLSFGYGALHTLGPGHGKGVVLSYFVGTGGSPLRGVAMGVRIAVVHVFSAMVVVFLLDFATRQTTGAAPSDYRAIRMGSYALITAIGLVMVWQAIAAIRATRKKPQAPLHDHDRHAHAPGPENHGHSAHDHAAHGHGDGRHGGCAACAAASTSGSGWIAASVGLVPCTGALIVMLFGLANDLLWPAILMVLAISAGMALAMSAIGMAALWGRSLAERRLGGNAHRLQRFELGARLTGALCVLAIGSVLFGVTAALQPVPQLATPELAMQLDR